MATLYKIKDWEKHFENYESKRYQTLKWVAIPNKHDGKGFRRIASLPNCERVLCGWYLMLELASKMPKRGILADDDGPLTPEDMALKTGFPVDCFRDAITSLISPQIGWMIEETRNNPAADLPQTCNNPAADLPQTCNNLPTNVSLHNITVHRSTEEDINTHAPGTLPPPKPAKLNGIAPEFEKFWAIYPKHQNKYEAERAFIEVRAMDHMPEIQRALAWQCKLKQWTDGGGRFIPEAKTWLLKKRWEDENQDPAVLARKRESDRHQEAIKRSAREIQKTIEGHA